MAKLSNDIFWEGFFDKIASIETPSSGPPIPQIKPKIEAKERIGFLLTMGSVLPLVVANIHAAKALSREIKGMKIKEKREKRKRNQIVRSYRHSF